MGALASPRDDRAHHSIKEHSQGKPLRAFCQETNNVTRIGGQNQPVIGNLDQGAPMAGFHIAQIVQQVNGLPNAARAAQQNMANRITRGQHIEKSAGKRGGTWGARSEYVMGAFSFRW